jgi:DNA-binding transcriptional regulator LsrR (DeoR family)
MPADELTQIAVLYYVDGMTQEELSKRFSMSRAKIGRLLRRAQEESVVEIRVRHHPHYTSELEQEIAARFGLQRVLISIDHKDQDKQRELLAGLVASHLDRALTENAIVAVGMGRNISAISEHAVSSTRRNCSFVCAIGGSYRGGEAMNADHICRRLARRFGGESETLYAPALVEDPQTLERILSNDTVKQTLDKARRADFALIGVGDISEDSNIMRMGWFTPSEIAEVKRMGAVGDMMGYDFVDLNGQPAKTPFRGRVVGLTLSDLRRIPNVVAVASEYTKTTAILGALRTGAIDTLATTESIARAVLNLEEATRPSGPALPDAAPIPIDVTS